MRTSASALPTFAVVGLRNALRLVDWANTDEPAGPATVATASSLYAVPSGSASADLPVEVAAAFGLSAGCDTISRREAMTVPAVKRGRAVIAGTIGTLPLVAGRVGTGGADPAGTEAIVAGATARLIEQPDPNTTRAHIVTWTVDDLLFSGVSWWRVTGRHATGFPANAERIGPERVGSTEHNGRRRITVDGELVDDRNIIRFDGPDEGVLKLGAGSLRTCLLLEAAVRNFARLDVPLGSIEPQEGADELSTAAGSADDGSGRSEVEAMLDGWEAARRGRTTAYLRRAKYVTHQLDARQLQLAEARQYQAGEVGLLMNLAPRYVNAPASDSLTYSTTEGDRRELVDLSLRPYLAAVADRLSMPDVTPRGHVVGFDLSAFLRGDLTAVTTAIAAGITDAAEARTWLGLAPRTDLPARPAAAAPEATA